jgi:YHS domain-containing protein
MDIKKIYRKLFFFLNFKRCRKLFIPKNCTFFSKIKNMKRIFLVLVVTIFCTSPTNAQTDLRKQHYNIERSIALQGYDPVAYFLQNKAVKGDKQFAVSADGVVYYLSSAANKILFLQDYKKYEPQYGGWCAYAMGNSNEKVEIDVNKFKIVEGKLYLFYYSWVNNTLNKWNKDQSNLKNKADANWSVTFR